MKKPFLSLLGFTLSALSSLAAESWSFASVRAFGFADLAATHPVGPLLRASDGAFYGVASRGLFRLEADGQGFRALPFASPEDAQGHKLLGTLWEGPTGRLYGASQGAFGVSAGVLAFERDGSSLRLLLHFSESNATWTVGEHLVVAPDGSVFGQAWRSANTPRALVFRISPTGEREDLHELPGPNPQSSPDPGLRRGLTADASGTLFGVTLQGGATNQGVAFRLRPDGSDFRILHEFGLEDPAVETPVGALLFASDGNFYGIARASFSSTNIGAVYRLTPDGVLTAVRYLSREINHPLPEGVLMEASDGRLYGTSGEDTFGIFSKIYRLHKDGSGFEIIYTSIAVSVGIATLTEGADQKLYTTSFFGPTDTMFRGEGSIFRIEKDGTGLTNLWIFHPTGNDGEYPGAPLQVGSDGILYGTTSGGGVGNAGTVFRVHRDGSAPEVLHAFQSQDVDGKEPSAGVIQGLDRQLYGAATYGGISNRGGLFRLHTDGSEFTVLHRFEASPDGANPSAPLTQGPDGTLYGTTLGGGTNGTAGTIFRLQPDGSEYRILHDFSPNSQSGQSVSSDAPLRLTDDGELVGTTRFGGPTDAGMVFALRTDGTGFRLLHLFTTNSGESFYPSRGGLVEGADGRFIGTSAGGSGFGTIYGIRRDGSEYQVLHRFTGGSGGTSSNSGLTRAPDGSLLGVIRALGSGGTNYGDGLLYRLDATGSNFTALATFHAGSYFFDPGQLALGPDAAFYGAERGGGEFAAGSIFRLAPPDYQPRFLPGTARQSGSGDFTAEILGTREQSVVVESAADLHQWSPVAGLRLTGEPVNFTAPSETNARARFFRVRVP